MLKLLHSLRELNLYDVLTTNHAEKIFLSVEIIVTLLFIAFTSCIDN